MRDLHLQEALKRLAADAATRFSTLVASGEQVPFDVAEQAGPDSLFHSYVPLTAQFVCEREGELRSLPTFEAAREAVEAAGVAAPYLEHRGEPVPAESGERAAQMLTSFFASLWDGCTEFSLDRERLEGALAVLDAEASDVDDADVLVAPLVGLRMPLPRLQFPRGVQIVRADAFEAPVEAMRSEGMGRAAWDPQYLALAEQASEDGSAEAALQQLRELTSVMRLFKVGGIGLGPHAFAPTGEGRWRRIATGVPAPRPGDYRLSEEEAGRLAELAAALESRPDPGGTLTWALARFEMGCSRESALEGLSDHLLSLRAVLEGQGQVGASLAMRAAALIGGEFADRTVARERVERAQQLERELMSGRIVDGGVELARWIEEGVRRILREAALGELGTDLDAAADESLIATGLASGDAEISVTVQGVGDPGMPGSEAEDMPRTAHHEPPQEEENHMEDHDRSHDTRILEPIPAEDEIRITATHWLDEVEVPEDGGTLEWPAGATDVEHRERIDTPRVRHLFPVPENADWEVRELDYDHYRRHTG